MRKYVNVVDKELLRETLQHSRVGERTINRKGRKFEIVCAVKYRNIVGYWFKVKFDSGYEVIVSKGNIRTGNVKDKFEITVANIGMMGYIILPKYSKLYSLWEQMLVRCYKKENPTYKYYGAKGVRVCKRWHRLDYFYKDVKTLLNYDSWLENKGYSLDKDFLTEGNKEYSKEHCSFQSRSIQSLYSKKEIGKSGERCIKWSESRKTWRVIVKMNGKRHYVAENKNLSKAKKKLMEFLKKFYPIHPLVRFSQ